jgi:hypothetical protein
MTEDNRDQNKPATKITLGNLLWPLAICAYAIFRVTRPGHLSMLSIVWYWTLAIFGALLAGAACLGRSLSSPTEAGKKIDDLHRDIYADVPHLRRQVGEQTIAEYKLDQRFFRRTTELLQALYFTKVADYVDTHLEQTVLWSRAVLRAFLSSDGAVMAAVYDMRVTGWYRVLQWMGVISRDFRTKEFESELSDGSFVCTSDGGDAGKTLEFPGISRRFLPKATTPAELFAAHQDHVREMLSQHPGVTVVILRSFDDLCAAQDRQNRMKSRHRNSSDFDPAANIASVNGKSLTPAQEEMAQEAAKAHAQRIAREAMRDK